jgi:hypothetical protein
VALGQVADVGQVIREGEPAQQRHALQSVFERVEVSPESGDVVKVVRRPWFQMFFRDPAELWGAQCARRDSNPRSHRFEVCGSIH